eukprot:403375263
MPLRDGQQKTTKNKNCENSQGNSQKSQLVQVSDIKVRDLDTLLRIWVIQLVENALERGAKYIEVCLYQLGKEGFDVIDNGRGIDENEFTDDYVAAELTILTKSVHYPDACVVKYNHKMQRSEKFYVDSRKLLDEELRFTNSQTVIDNLNDKNFEPQQCIHMYVNGRPVESTKRMKAIFQQLYRDFMIAEKTIPFVFMSIETTHQNYDLKLQADIRKFFFKPEIEKNVYEKIRSLFLQRFNQMCPLYTDEQIFKRQQADLEIQGDSQEIFDYNSQGYKQQSQEIQEIKSFQEIQEIRNNPLRQVQMYTAPGGEDPTKFFPEQNIIKVSPSVMKKKLKKLKYRKYPLKKLVNVYVISNSPAMSDEEDQRKLSYLYEDDEEFLKDEDIMMEPESKRMKIQDLAQFETGFVKTLEEQDTNDDDGDDDLESIDQKTCFSEDSTTATYFPEYTQSISRMSTINFYDQEQFFSEQFENFKNDKSLYFSLEQMIFNEQPFELEDLDTQTVSKFSFKQRLRPKFQRSTYENHQYYHDRLMFDLNNDMMRKKFWKKEFMRLRILGQFNNGFIIGNLNQNDIFILDQHACDERLHLEKYTGSLKIDSQPLIQPIIIQYDTELYEILETYQRIFNAFGFQFEKMFWNKYQVQIKVHSLPQSNDTQFEESDFHNLVTAIRNFDTDDRTKNKYITDQQIFDYLMPKKIMQVLALKACRKSVMVGKKLERRQQYEIVSGLSNLKDPWICAHGRPTMRYIMDIQDFQDKLLLRSTGDDRLPPKLELKLNRLQLKKDQLI